jgi:signal transduction histidine kinase
MSKVRGILFILIVTSVALLVTIVFYSQEQIRQQSSIIETERIVIVNQLASRIDLIITNAEKILENAAKDENIKNSPSAPSIDKNLHGIPESVDKEKRIVIRNILSTYQDFESVGYILPNGDIYFVEPYNLQKTLSKSNFSFRDYYKAVTATHDTYVGSIIVSAATNHPVATIAVPIFSENGSMVGMLSSGVDLLTIQKRLKELNSYANERILVVDNNKALVADSAAESNYKSGQILPEIGAMQDALAGKNGTTVESINGQKMFLAYHTIRAGQNTWAVVSMQPYDEAFQSVEATIQESYILGILILIITSLSSYYVYRGFQLQRKITKELERSNQFLHHAQEELKAVEKSKEEFSAMVTHELKTPLVPIIGYCKMLKKSMLGKLNEEEANAIEVIEKNAKSLEELISDVMDIHKLDIDKMKFRFENLSLNEFLVNLDSTYKKVLKDKGIEFVTKLSIKDVVIHADEARFRQVFDNLINNSMKFVSENKVLIEVGGYEQKDGLILYVKDNGIGIPKDKQNELFKKFYQVDTSLTRPVGGTGLGLAISKGIMDKLGGTIWVESDGKTGATFYLKLPLVK